MLYEADWLAALSLHQFFDVMRVLFVDEIRDLWKGTLPLFDKLPALCSTRLF